MAVQAPEVLATFHGDEIVSDRLGGRRGGAVLGAGRPPLPEPALAALLRPRRVVADLRPHVPPVRDAVRGRLGREERQRLPLHGGDPGRPVRAGGGERVPGALRASRPARLRIRGEDGRVPRLRPAPLRRQLPRLVARPAAPRDRAELRLPRRATTPTGRRWSSSPCCSRTRSTSTTVTGRSTGCSTSRSSRRRWP